jgi:adenylosuccinate synthase
MERELNWEEITKRSGSPNPLQEITTVTKRVRRVAEFDYDLIVRAIQVCGITDLAVTFLNYLDWADYDKMDFGSLSQKSKDFIQRLQEVIGETGAKITYLSTGPATTFTMSHDLAGTLNK